MHLIRGTSFVAEKIVNTAKYAGLKADNFQSDKVLSITKYILYSNCKYKKHITSKFQVGHLVIFKGW